MSVDLYLETEQKAELKLYGDNELTPAEKRNIALNSTARHTHENKEVIDGITAEAVTRWNSSKQSNLLSYWQPNTEYKDGDMVGYIDSESGYIHFFQCKVAHASSESFDNDFSYWNQFSVYEAATANTSGNAACDSEGNAIVETYARKDEIDAALTQAKESGEFDGADGYTPKKGVDYWTDVDKKEIKSYVDEAILGGAW